MGGEANKRSQNLFPLENLQINMNRVDMMYVLSDQSVHMQGPVVQSPLA